MLILRIMQSSLRVSKSRKKISSARSFCDAIVKKNFLIRSIENVDIQTHDWFNVHLALSRSWILILISEVWLFVILITIMTLLLLSLILLCESLLSSTKQWNSTLLVNSRFGYRSRKFFQRCVWIMKNLSSRHEICIISRRKWDVQSLILWHRFKHWWDSSMKRIESLVINKTREKD
jgi:hypothetical protein